MICSLFGVPTETVDPDIGVWLYEYSGTPQSYVVFDVYDQVWGAIYKGTGVDFSSPSIDVYGREYKIVGDWRYTCGATLILQYIDFFYYKICKTAAATVPTTVGD